MQGAAETHGLVEDVLDLPRPMDDRGIQPLKQLLQSPTCRCESEQTGRRPVVRLACAL